MWQDKSSIERFLDNREYIWQGFSKFKVYLWSFWVTCVILMSVLIFRWWQSDNVFRLIFFIKFTWIDWIIDSSMAIITLKIILSVIKIIQVKLSHHKWLFFTVTNQIIDGQNLNFIKKNFVRWNLCHSSLSTVIITIIY